MWIRNQCSFSLPFQNIQSFYSESMPHWQPTHKNAKDVPSPEACWTVGIRTSLFLWEYRINTFHPTTVSAPETNPGSFWQRGFSPERRLGEVEHMVSAGRGIDLLAFSPIFFPLYHISVQFFIRASVVCLLNKRFLRTYWVSKETTQEMNYFDSIYVKHPEKTNR